MSATIEDKKNYHLCLDIAMEIMDLIESGGTAVTVAGMRGREVHIDRVTELIQLHLPEQKFSIELSDKLGEEIAHSLATYGMSVCAVWSIAHGLEHALFP